MKKNMDLQKLQPAINSYQITKNLAKKTQDLLVTVKHRSVKTTS